MALAFSQHTAASYLPHRVQHCWLVRQSSLLSTRASFWGAGASLLQPRARRAQRCKCLAPQANEINKWCEMRPIKEPHAAHLVGDIF